MPAAAWPERIAVLPTAPDVADGRKTPRGVGGLTPPVAALPQGLRPFGLGAVLIPVDLVEIET